MPRRFDHDVWGFLADAQTRSPDHPEFGRMAQRRRMKEGGKGGGYAIQLKRRLSAWWSLSTDVDNWRFAIRLIIFAPIVASILILGLIHALLDWIFGKGKKYE
jgi:hypothetical protein